MHTLRTIKFDCSVDFRLGGEPAHREANRAVRQFVRAAECAQHVGGFEAGRGAGGAAGNGDSLHRHHQRLAFDEIEADVEIVRHAGLKVAVDVGFVDGIEAGEQLVAQCPYAFIFRSHLLARQTKRLAHADDLVRRQRAGAHAALVSAAMHLRLDAHARLAAHIQRADALRAVGLVRRERHQVDRQCLQIDRHFARGLRRIDVKQHAARAADVADGVRCPESRRFRCSRA